MALRPGDPGPFNTVFRAGLPAAFIDWSSCRPGGRLEDLGYMAWTWCIQSQGHVRRFSFRVCSGTRDIGRLFVAHSCTAAQLGSDHFSAQARFGLVRLGAPAGFEPALTAPEAVGPQCDELRT